MTGEPIEPETRSSEPEERRQRSDRRQGDRRQAERPVEVERRSGVDRRQVPDRRGVNRYELSFEEMEFVQAIQRFKERTGKSFPTWSEVLGILRSLGYEKRG